MKVLEFAGVAMLVVAMVGIVSSNWGEGALILAALVAVPLVALVRAILERNELARRLVAAPSPGETHSPAEEG